MDSRYGCIAARAEARRQLIEGTLVAARDFSAARRSMLVGHGQADSLGGWFLLRRISCSIKRSRT